MNYQALDRHPSIGRRVGQAFIELRGDLALHRTPIERRVVRLASTVRVQIPYSNGESFDSRQFFNARPGTLGLKHECTTRHGPRFVDRWARRTLRSSAECNSLHSLPARSRVQLFGFLLSGDVTLASARHRLIRIGVRSRVGIRTWSLAGGQSVRRVIFSTCGCLTRALTHSWRISAAAESIGVPWTISDRAIIRRTATQCTSDKCICNFHVQTLRGSESEYVTHLNTERSFPRHVLTPWTANHVECLVDRMPWSMLSKQARGCIVTSHVFTTARPRDRRTHRAHDADFVRSLPTVSNAFFSAQRCGLGASAASVPPEPRSYAARRLR